MKKTVSMRACDKRCDNLRALGWKSVGGSRSSLLWVHPEEPECHYHTVQAEEVTLMRHGWAVHALRKQGFLAEMWRRGSGDPLTRVEAIGMQVFLLANPDAYPQTVAKQVESMRPIERAKVAEELKGSGWSPTWTHATYGTHPLSRAAEIEEYVRAIRKLTSKKEG